MTAHCSSSPTKSIDQCRNTHQGVSHVVQGFWAFNIAAQCELNAWICAPETERDLASFSAVKKVSAWLCALATDRVSGFSLDTCILKPTPSSSMTHTHVICLPNTRWCVSYIICQGFIRTLDDPQPFLQSLPKSCAPPCVFFRILFKECGFHPVSR